ncbi:SdrD B-like domain-containing protein [Epibacterium ulvae]|uniref:SdrD B-like domain-containing protein n=1 Tax=Epibacterium ulvae TaxID=1156985 RepID=UPI0024904D02|nr:SdrD B-like domain-containing protein [Epibacterium ulvae]
MIKSIGNFFDNVFHTVGDVFHDIVSTAYTEVSGALGAAWDALTAVVNAPFQIAEGVGQLLEGNSDGWHTIGNAMFEMVATPIQAAAGVAIQCFVLTPISLAKGAIEAIGKAVGVVELDKDGAGEIKGQAFCDVDGNNRNDDNEGGVAGMTVELLAADGTVLASVLTVENGNYKFTGLAYGDYSVRFKQESTSGKEFVEQDAAVSNNHFLWWSNEFQDDHRDSDVDIETGVSQPITIDWWNRSHTVDSGLKNTTSTPEAVADSAETCVEEPVIVDVLANDSDPDGDPLSVTQVNGVDIVEGQTIDISGVQVTLTNGSLTFDGSTAPAVLTALEQAESAIVNFTYRIEDGNGGFSESTVSIGFNSPQGHGVGNGDLPNGTFGVQILRPGAANQDDWYTAHLTDVGSNQDTIILESVYSGDKYAGLAAGNNLIEAPVMGGSFSLLSDDTFNFKSGEVSPEIQVDKIDNAINWILNQGFEDEYTEAEIQGAIWGITDDIIYVPGDNGEHDNALFIYEQALAHGQDYETEAGGVFGAVINPIDTNPDDFIDHSQIMLVGLQYDHYANQLC